METARSKRKWVFDVGYRPVYWLLNSFREERFVTINRDLLQMLLDAMSPGHLVLLRRLLRRYVA